MQEIPNEKKNPQIYEMVELSNDPPAQHDEGQHPALKIIDKVALFAKNARSLKSPTVSREVEVFMHRIAVDSG